MAKHEYTFNITPDHLLGWAELNRDAPEGSSISRAQLAEILLETLFIPIFDTKISHFPARNSVKCLDSSLTKGERSVEIESQYPLSANSLTYLMYRVTVIDTLAPIEDVERSLRKEGLVIDEVLLKDNVKHEPKQPDGEPWLWILGIIGAVIVLYAIGSK